MKINKKNRKAIVLTVLLIVLMLATAGATIAYLVHHTNTVTNTFEPSKVTCEVDEPTWEQGYTLKENVKIKNTGDIDAYIRASIVITWQDSEGKIYGEYPAADDYTLVLDTENANSDWVYAGGYYYFKEKVAPADFTDVLIHRCEVNAAGPTGYTLHVEVLAEAIQADGVSSSDVTGGAGRAPVDIAWSVKDKISVTIGDNGKLVVTPLAPAQ